MNKLIVTLVSFPCETRHEVKITRLPKDGKSGRCVTLKYTSRINALSGYWTICARLGEDRLHQASGIEN